MTISENVKLETILINQVAIMRALHELAPERNELAKQIKYTKGIIDKFNKVEFFGVTAR